MRDTTTRYVARRGCACILDPLLVTIQMLDSSFAALKNADVEEAGLVLLTKLSAGALSRNDRLPRGRAKRTIASRLHA